MVSLITKRKFIAGLGGAALAARRAARAQQAMPVIGFLYAGSAGPVTSQMAVFRRTLAEAGYIESQNVAIETLYAEGRYDQLPALAAELVRRRVTLILATPNSNSARAAKAATATIPILFSVAEDPTRLGLVASLSRPGGNATGVNYFLTELTAKRLGLLHELLPTAARFSVLINPDSGLAEAMTREVKEISPKLAVAIDVVYARDTGGIEAAFAAIAGSKTVALCVAPDTFFSNRRIQIITLATRHGIPAIYTVREYVEAGGLMSYGTSLFEVYRQLGLYAVRILKGANVADLPVVQSTKFELVINLPTARALGLDIPPTLLARADEVIE